VQRVLTDAQIANRGVMQAVGAIAYDHFREICSEHADTLVSAWVKPFDRAASTLRRAMNASASTARRHSRNHAPRRRHRRRWAETTAAVSVIDTIVIGWQALGDFTRKANNDRRYHALRLADVDYQTWQTRSLAQRPLTPGKPCAPA
jgi:hypothetical protein